MIIDKDDVVVGFEITEEDSPYYSTVLCKPCFNSRATEEDEDGNKVFKDDYSPVRPILKSSLNERVGEGKKLVCDWCGDEIE